jgi:hypothetical protein
MRASLVLVVVGAAAVAACSVASLERSAQAQESRGSAPAASSSSSLDDTARDVEVMRRVLVRVALSTRNENSDSKEVMLGNVFWANANYGSEAFVVPGIGATFVLRTSDCVAPQPGDEASPSGKPSVWDEEEDGLEGRPSLKGRRVRGQVYEAAKVEALKSRVLDVLRQYATRIRGIPASERLTVLVVGGGGQRVVTTDTTGQGGGFPARFYSQQGDGRTVLSMHVSVGDCQAAANGSLSSDEFRRRAVVSAY